MKKTGILFMAFLLLNSGEASQTDPLATGKEVFAEPYKLATLQPEKKIIYEEKPLLGTMKVTANGKTFTFPEGTSVEGIGDALDDYFSGQTTTTKKNSSIFSDEDLMIYTRKQLMTALRNADAAGNTPVATRIAQMVRAQEQMAKPWKEVIASPQYKALPAEQQAQAQAQYFKEVVAPRAGNATEEARQQFYAAYPPSVIPTAIQQKPNYFDQYDKPQQRQDKGSIFDFYYNLSNVVKFFSNLLLSLAVFFILREINTELSWLIINKFSKKIDSEINRPLAKPLDLKEDEDLEKFYQYMVDRYSSERFSNRFSDFIGTCVTVASAIFSVSIFLWYFGMVAFMASNNFVESGMLWLPIIFYLFLILTKKLVELLTKVIFNRLPGEAKTFNKHYDRLLLIRRGSVSG